MSKSEEARTDATRELDCSNAGRGVWLVKVPKYIAKKWLKGKIYVTSRKFKMEVFGFNLAHCSLVSPFQLKMTLKLES